MLVCKDENRDLILSTQATDSFSLSHSLLLSSSTLSTRLDALVLCTAAGIATAHLNSN